MKPRRVSNSSKRALVYLSVVLLYIIVFTNLPLHDKLPQALYSSAGTDGSLTD